MKINKTFRIKDKEIFISMYCGKYSYGLGIGGLFGIFNNGIIFSGDCIFFNITLELLIN